MGPRAAGGAGAPSSRTHRTPAQQHRSGQPSHRTSPVPDLEDHGAVLVSLKGATRHCVMACGHP